jgi:N-acyl homoserine lactone hydrolase
MTPSGDGSIVLLPAPGPTPGSMSLLVRRPGQAPLIMTGDVIDHTHPARSRPRTQGRQPTPPAGTTAMTNSLRRRYPALVILPAHDPGAALAAWPRPPARHRHWRQRSCAGHNTGGG